MAEARRLRPAPVPASARTARTDPAAATVPVPVTAPAPIAAPEEAATRSLWSRLLGRRP
ncbi:hypothetical protein ACFW9D_22355 [Streptomyces sp. NPDC059524]|uniref:hypothetical protein n=1 Tax=Streptomyces sp. NPDC059524 TaxID=3346856 RepID=UPI0036B7CBC6